MIPQKNGTSDLGISLQLVAAGASEIFVSPWFSLFEMSQSAVSWRFQQLLVPSGKRSHSNGKPPFLLGYTFSNGGFPIAMLVYRSVAGKILSGNDHAPPCRYFWVIFRTSRLVGYGFVPCKLHKYTTYFSSESDSWISLLRKPNFNPIFRNILLQKPEEAAPFQKKIITLLRVMPTMTFQNIHGACSSLRGWTWTAHECSSCGQSCPFEVLSCPQPNDSAACHSGHIVKLAAAMQTVAHPDWCRWNLGSPVSCSTSSTVAAASADWLSFRGFRCMSRPTGNSLALPVCRAGRKKPMLSGTLKNFRARLSNYLWNTLAKQITSLRRPLSSWFPSSDA